MDRTCDHHYWLQWMLSLTSCVHELLLKAPTLVLLQLLTTINHHLARAEMKERRPKWIKTI